MFKKSLIAVAVLGATAFSVQAADVTMYGKVDLGLQYKSSEVTVGDKTMVDEDTFSMENGRNSASRFGIKGSEDLGNGMKVSFQLENGFKADSGEFKTSGKLFDRQATVALSSDFGTLTMGRVGGVGSGAGFDLGSGDVLGLLQSALYDNMVTYQTPKFAGLQATVQYSFNEDSVKETAREGSSAVNRYASAALTGDFGALQTVLAYEFQNYQSFGTDVNPSVEDGHTVYLGGNYDFGVTRLFAMAQYFKGLSATQLTAIADETRAETADNMWSDGAKGYGLHLGTVTPVFGGDFTAGLYFVDAKFQNGANAANQNDADLSYYGAALRYGYPLSKRTTVYTGVGYGVSKLEFNNNGQDVEAKNQVGQAYLGLTHMF
mgnify:CR=1 FL=1